MNRTVFRILLIVTGIVAVLGAGAIAWHLRERTWEVYTDADSIRLRADDAEVRDVLWEPAKALSSVVNTDAGEYTPRTTADGGTLYFVRGRAGGNADIWVSRRIGADWETPVPFEAVNTLADELDPEPSPDGSAIYFHSNRAGGLGGYDLWVVRRDGEDWGEPENLGPAVNSPYHDYGPAITPDGTHLYFSSNRPAPGEQTAPDDGLPSAVARDIAERDFDLYLVSLDATEADSAVPVTELNSPDDEGAPTVSPAGDFVYFASDRAGGAGGFDLYRARRMHGGHRAAERLDDAVNTPWHELDPACGQGGFELHFSSNRPRAVAEGEVLTAADFDIFRAQSREVFTELDAYRAELDWGEIWRLVAPLLLWLVLIALVILALLRLQKSQMRRLTLIARCVLGSILVHLIALALFSIWQVTTSLAGSNRDNSSTKVMIVSSSVGQGLAQQVRGGLTQIESAMTPADSASRQAAEVAQTPAASTAQLAVARATIESTSSAEVEASALPEAAVQPTRAPRPTTSQALEVNTSMQVEIPVQPTPVHVAEAGPAQPTAADAGPRSEATAQPVSAQPPSPTTLAVATDVAPSEALSDQQAVQPLLETGPAADVEAQQVQTTDRQLATDRINPDAPTSVELPAAPSGERGSAPEAPTVLAAGGSSALRDTARPRAVGGASSSTSVEVAPDPTPDLPTGGSLAAATPAADATAASPTPAMATADAPPRTIDDLPMPDVNLPGAPPSAVMADASDDDSDLPTSPQSGRRSSRAPSEAPSDVLVEIDPAVDGGSLEPGADRMFAAAMPAEAAPTSSLPPWMRPDRPGIGPGDSETGPLALPKLEEFDAPLGGEEVATNDLPISPSDSDRAGLGHLSFLDREHEPKLREPEKVERTEALREHRSLIELIPVDPPVELAINLPDFDLSRPSPDDPIQFDLPDESEPVLPVAEGPFAQRDERVRDQMLEEHGGSAETEAAVAAALDWLARHQEGDGRWSGKGFDDHCGRCGGDAKVDADIALTGLSLLCFFAADHGPHHSGPYSDAVARGVRWLVSQQDPYGDLTGTESLYSQGIATMALAEAYGITKDPALRQPLQSAVDFIFRARNKRVGGWRYDPGQAGDTSVLGWQIMALTSARRAGVEVPEEAFDVGRRWLENVRDPWRPELYCYQPKRRPSPAMTAEALFVHHLLGSDRDAMKMRASAQYVVDNPPVWDEDANTYYWYYATLGLFQYGEDLWPQWNEKIKSQLLARQRTEGNATGSWDPDGKWANVGGRVYQTAMCTLTLEVYYRYLPLYVTSAAE